MWNKTFITLISICFLVISSGCDSSVNTVASVNKKAEDSLTPHELSGDITQEFQIEFNEIYLAFDDTSSKNEDLTKYENDLIIDFVKNYTGDKAKLTSAPEKNIIALTQLAYASYNQNRNAIKNEGAPNDNKYKKEFDDYLGQLKPYYK